MDTNKNTISYSDYLKGITSLSADEQLTLIKVLSSALKKTIFKRRGKNSIMALEGLGADIWKGIDAQEYVKRERESWD